MATSFFQSIRTRRDAALLLAGFSLIGVVGLVSAGKAPSDVEQLLASEHAWAKAAVDGDADKMASLMADEYVELAWEPATPTTPAHWTATRKREWVEAVRRHTKVYTSVDLRNLTVHVQGALAVARGGTRG